MSAAPVIVAERVRAIDAEWSGLTAEGKLPERTAEDAPAAVLCGSAMRETPLCPPPVGSQPLVDPDTVLSS